MFFIHLAPSKGCVLVPEIFQGPVSGPAKNFYSAFFIFFCSRAICATTFFRAVPP